MPRRRYNKKGRKNLGRKKRNGYKKSKLRNKVPNGAAPLARKHIVRLKYTEVIDWSPTTLQTLSQQYRLNSVYDPNVTGVGHQPYGFDQLAALFNHYRVFKCSWHVAFAPSNDRLHIAVGPVNGSSTFSSVESLGEFPSAVSRVLGYSGGIPCVFKGSCYLPRLTGATSVQYRTDDRYSSIVSDNPAEAMNLNIAVYNPSGSTVATSMTITLVYHTEFYDPLVLGPS